MDFSQLHVQVLLAATTSKNLLGRFLCAIYPYLNDVFLGIMFNYTKELSLNKFLPPLCIDQHELLKRQL